MPRSKWKNAASPSSRVSTKKSTVRLHLVQEVACSVDSCCRADSRASSVTPAATRSTRAVLVFVRKNRPFFIFLLVFVFVWLDKWPKMAVASSDRPSRLAKQEHRPLHCGYLESGSKSKVFYLRVALFVLFLIDVAQLLYKQLKNHEILLTQPKRRGTRSKSPRFPLSTCWWQLQAEKACHLRTRPQSVQRIQYSPSTSGL